MLENLNVKRSFKMFHPWFIMILKYPSELIFRVRCFAFFALSIIPTKKVGQKGRVT